jgi:murein DD-endopeptidase MepM/ murein hydrolase activator NlpD
MAGLAGAGVAATGLSAPAVVLPPPPRPSPLFGLPFAGPASMRSWFVDQWYGNTTFAYRMRREFYQFGQGLHFGVDIAAPCHTQVLAIGDGVVREVDGVRRAWPHHVVIDHPNGASSLYGHLIERSGLRRGDETRQGDVIGVSGDSATLQCNGSPHLHLEIRYADMLAATNPILWIDADWPSLTLGISQPAFQVDLDEPGRWQSIYDQPDVTFWGPALNEYTRTWPST